MHDSIKFNATHFITFKIKPPTMQNQKSLQNLTGKTNSGFLSDRSIRLLENTVFNYLHDDHEKQKKKSQNNSLTQTPPQNPTAQNAQRGGVFVSENVLRNYTHNPKYFITLTAQWNSKNLADERNLFKAFRFFLKQAQINHQLNYIWKCEKTTEEHQHFHLVGDFCHSVSLLSKLWIYSCAKFDILAFDYSADFQQINNTETDYKRVSRYMAKQTKSPVDGKLFSMSLSMRKFKPKVIKRNPLAVEQATANANLIYTNPFCDVYENG